MSKKQIQSKSSVLLKAGTIFIYTACLLWLSIVVVPLLSLSSAMKATIVVSLLIIGEVAFWLGAILVGKELVGKYKKYLNPKNWRSRQ